MTPVKKTTAAVRRPSDAWPSPKARKAAYDAMEAEYGKSVGFGHVPPAIREGEGLEYQDRRTEAYLDYINDANTRLKAMTEIAAIVEDRTPDEVLRKVRGF